jgi:hypothetical protein
MAKLGTCTAAWRELSRRERWVLDALGFQFFDVLMDLERVIGTVEKASSGVSADCREVYATIADKLKAAR